MVGWLADGLVFWCLDWLVCWQVGLAQLIGWALGRSSGVLLACLVDWLVVLVSRWLVAGWVFGQWVDWLFDPKYVCLVGRWAVVSVSYSVFGWKTGWSGFWWVCLSAVRSDNQQFVWLVDHVVVSCTWSVGRPFCRLGGGWIG